MINPDELANEVPSESRVGIWGGKSIRGVTWTGRKAELTGDGEGAID